MENPGETANTENPKSKEDDHNRDVDKHIEALLSRDRCLRRRRNFMHEAPEFCKRLNAYEEVDAGSPVVFSCQYQGFPKPNIKWYRDDEEVTDEPRYTYEEGDNGHLSLIIPQTCKKDEGALKCKAENSEGVASTTGYLSVKGDIKDKPLSAQPRANVEHAVSTPPHLRTIIEQKSVEEREEEEQSRLPPSPIHDFIEEQQSLLRRGLINWPQISDELVTKVDVEEDMSSGSDTSVESQNYERNAYEELREATPESDLQIKDDEPPGGMMIDVQPGVFIMDDPSELNLEEQMDSKTENEVCQADEAYSSLNGSHNSEDESKGDTSYVANAAIVLRKDTFDQEKWAQRYAQQVIDNSLQIVEDKIYNSLYDESLQHPAVRANSLTSECSIDSGFYENQSPNRTIDQTVSLAEEKELVETLSRYREIVQEVTETVQNVNNAERDDGLRHSSLAQPHHLVVEDISSYIQCHKMETPKYKFSVQAKEPHLVVFSEAGPPFPWVYFLAMVSVATFFASASGASPGTFCLSIAALSLISFQYLEKLIIFK